MHAIACTTSQLGNLYSQPDLPVDIFTAKYVKFGVFKGVRQWELSFSSKWASGNHVRNVIGGWFQSLVMPKR